MFFTDLETWLNDYSDEKVFRVLKSKTVFTPYEQENKFVDESDKETVIQYGKIEEVIELPDKEILIGFREIDINDNDEVISFPTISYYILSQISFIDVTQYWKEYIGEDND